MRKLKRVSIFICFLMVACKLNRKKVTLYVVNNSRMVSNIEIEVLIDSAMVVNQNFSYSAVTPDYTTFSSRNEKGVYSITVKAGNLIKKDTFKLDNDIFLYISFDASLKPNGDTGRGLGLYKTYKNYEHY